MNDTIAAIATATGGGVGIIRISGLDAERIVRSLCPSLATLPSHQLVLADVVDGEVLDEVLVVVMRAPRSYTGEDVAELHGHGGAANLQRLLDAVLARGARLATPGEFTRRAFVAGKLDLTQAEAVATLIGARDERTLRAAQALRAGALGRQVESVRRAVVDELAELEGALDFPDETLGDDAPIPIRAARLRELSAGLAARATHYRRPLGVVPEVVLVGAVNAGKSSLLNALVGEERALVDSEPGTTRDVVEAELDLGPRIGLVRLVDTAGLRATPTELERRGQTLAEARRTHATLVLLVFDGHAGFPDEHLDALAGAAPVVLVANKSDLELAQLPPDCVRVSARTGAGLDALRERIAQALGHGDEELAVSSARQAEALRLAAASIDRAVAALLGESEVAAPEVAAVDLRRGLSALGQLTGETASEEVLDALFARFCIGK